MFRVPNFEYSHNKQLFVKPNQPKIRYTFAFASLITPHKITNVRLFTNSRPSFCSKKTNKLFVKQSYLLMTWLWYIQKKHSSTKKPSFAFKPTSTSKTTIIKAPMAHKTFSQEQLQFKFFHLVIAFTVPWKAPTKTLSINQSLYLLLQLKNSIPFVETNLFLLKRFTITLPLSDSGFLKI